jgi:hypothetical protein
MICTYHCKEYGCSNISNNKFIPLTVKQVPFTTPYTPSPDDGLQMGLKHVEAC